jgi:EpsI family protein
MGPILLKKIIGFIILLVMTSAVIYGFPRSEPSRKKTSLKQTLSDIKGWNNDGVVELDGEIVKALDLDDYANQGFSSDKGSVFLYIGYYFSNKKIGAAHDPLVCFPGQGWVASNIQKRAFSVDSAGKMSVYASTMTVEKGMQKELVVYWFQANDRSASGTFWQKVNGLWNRLSKRPEDNAFVRVTISLKGKTSDEAYSIAHQFIKSFYPAFLNYING